MVCEQNAAACLLAGTLKHHRVVVIKMATAGTSAMRLESQKAKKWALTLAIPLSKLKTHVVRKREIYCKERVKDEENL